MTSSTTLFLCLRRVYLPQRGREQHYFFSYAHWLPAENLSLGPYFQLRTRFNKVLTAIPDGPLGM